MPRLLAHGLLEAPPLGDDAFLPAGEQLAQLAQQLLHLALGLGGEFLPGMAGRAGLGDVLRRPQRAHLGGVEGRCLPAG